MSVFQFTAQTPRFSARLRAYGAGLALIAMAASALPGCASAEPYNPAGLGGDQLARVTGICRSVMGLSPSEPPSLVWGAAANPDLTGGENHYQGCIASLSAAQRRIDAAYSGLSADAACARRGFSSGSPERAECVLNSEARLSGEAVRTPVSDATDAAPASPFYRANAREATRREAQACARLGLNPAYSAFDDCVKDMKDTFYSIDNPRD